MILCLVSFWVLFLASLAIKKGFFSQLKQKSHGAWGLDFAGLFLQGWFVPLFASFGLVQIWGWTLPQAKGAWEVSAPLAFMISFVGIDFVYYWNHRLLHQKRLWPLHAVHHTAEHMDIFVSARNSIFTVFFLCYLWFNSLVAYVLKQPEAFLFAASLTASLDMWRHSTLQPKGVWASVLGTVLVLPTDHAWHHSSEQFRVNFGANLCVWDKMFGTFYRSHKAPSRLGLPSNERPTEAEGMNLLLYPLGPSAGRKKHARPS